MAKKTVDLSDLEDAAQSSGFNRASDTADSKPTVQEKPAKQAPAKKPVSKGETYEAETVVVKKVALPKGKNKNDWTKVSFLVPPNVAKSIGFLMESEESRTPKGQHVFEQYAFNAILQAAINLGFDPDQ